MTIKLAREPTSEAGAGHVNVTYEYSVAGCLLSPIEVSTATVFVQPSSICLPELHTCAAF